MNPLLLLIGLASGTPSSTYGSFDVGSVWAKPAESYTHVGVVEDTTMPVPVPYTIPPGDTMDISLGLAFVGVLFGITHTTPGPQAGLFVRGVGGSVSEGFDSRKRSGLPDFHPVTFRGELEMGARMAFCKRCDIQLGGYAGIDFTPEGLGKLYQDVTTFRTGGVVRVQLMQTAAKTSRFGVYLSLQIGSRWDAQPYTYDFEREPTPQTRSRLAMEGTLSLGLAYQFRP